MCGCNGTCGSEETSSTAKGLVKINYKEDFELVVELLAGDKPYQLGDEDFRIDFIVMASHYTVGRTAGVCERCSVDGNKVRCFMDSHGLPPGELHAEVKVNTPDPNYADGKRLNVAIAEGTVLLVKDNTRFDGAVIKASMSFAVTDAYQLAKAHGYKGTIDEYYSTFNDVSALLESMRAAEEQRVKAEEERQKNRVVVDAELSETSENPIMNKAVWQELEEMKKDAEVYHKIAMARISGKKELNGKDFLSLKTTRIPREAFGGFTELSKVTLLNNIKSIGIYAFKNCTSLKSITIPAGVLSIGGGAFEGCSSLTKITIPTSVKDIGINAFYGCSALQEVSIPAGVTRIEKGAFACCSSLADISLPNSLQSIGEYAFTECTSLKSITIPAGVLSIGCGAFNGCSSLAKITIPTNVKKIDKYTFYGCSALQKVSIPAGVTRIEKTAFVGCSSLADISLPNNLQSIGEYVFQDCTSLRSVTVPAGVTEIKGGVFLRCPMMMHITVDKNNKIYDSRNGCNAVIETATGTIVAACNATVIPINVTKIGESAFASLAFTEIILPDGVTEIGRWAFWGCASLTNITIPDTVKSIGAAALKKCTSLASITFKGTMKQWGEIDKLVDWNLEVNADAVIRCKDGDIKIC